MIPPNKATRIWRQVLRGPLAVTVPGIGPIIAPQGAYVESAIFRHLVTREDRTRLGETLPDAHLEKRIGHRPPEGQLIVDPDARAPAAPVAPVPTVERAGTLPPGVAHHPAAANGAEFIVIAPHDTEFPDAAIAECVRLLQRTPDIDVAIPLHNIGHPICAPVSKDEARSGVMRLPAGRSPTTIATALLTVPEASTPLVPDEIACAVVRASALAAWEAGTLPREKAATCLSAFAWRRPGSPAVKLWGDTTEHHPTTPLIQPVREAVARSRNPGIPALFVSSGAGPVGGTQVVLNLVDALNDAGIAASFTHLAFDNFPHKFRARTAPVPLRKAEMVRDIEDRLGWKRGERAVIVATSFASGSLVAEVCRTRPHFTPVAWWQDREDTFERPDGRGPHASEFSDFFAIRRCVSVSRWVADSARAELGIDGEWTVINPTVDPDFGGARPSRKDGPVRILSMWRPMTPVRRGLPLLRETYERLAKKYKGRVSLELFGWPEDAPAGVVHHGHLDTRQVAALMREVDAVVEPSASQGLGLPGMEALASGACLVSTTCRGVDEYARHEENALVVPHADLFKAVGRAVEDADLRDRLAGAGPASVRPWSAVAGDWADLLRAYVTA